LLPWFWIPRCIIRQAGTLIKTKDQTRNRKEARHIMTGPNKAALKLTLFHYGFIGAGAAGVVGGGWITFCVGGRGFGLGVV